MTDLDRKEYRGDTEVPYMDTIIALGSGQRFSDGKTEYCVTRAGVANHRAFVEISPPDDDLAATIIREIERNHGTFNAETVGREMGALKKRKAEQDAADQPPARNDADAE